MTRRPLGRPSANALSVAGPTLLAAALVLWQLSTRSLWLDEGASVAIASQHGDLLWKAIAHDGGNMLAFYLLLHGMIAVFGASETAIRLPAALATVATVATVSTIGLRVGGRRVAVAAGGLVAVSLPIVFWGQDARGYAPMVTFSSASWLALLGVLDTPDGEPVPRRGLLAYGLATLVAMYLGFVAILIVPAQLLLLAWRPARARAVIGCLAVVAMGCVPLLVLALRRGSSQLFWVPHPSLSVLKQAAVTLTSTGLPPNFHPRGYTTAALIASGALIVAALAVALLAGVRRRALPALLPTAWFAVPATLGLLASVAGEPIELARGSILLIPAIALLLAWAAEHGPLPFGTGWLLVVAVIAVRVLALMPSYGTSPENWRAAVRAVTAGQRPHSCVAFYPQDTRMPFDFYVRAEVGRAPTPVYPALPFAVVRPFVEQYRVPDRARLAVITHRCAQLWLVASHDGQRRGPPVSRADYHRYERLLSALGRRYPREQRRLFGYAAVIRVVEFSR